jgi:asparagine synthetase B (glutamine-hydrolysing)
MHLQPHWSVANFHWKGETALPAFAPQSVADALHELAAMSGQFAFAHQVPSGAVLLARDRLGVNKLFFAVHKSGTLHVANQMHRLMKAGAPLEAIFSVPSGHLLEVHPASRQVGLHPYFSLREAATTHEQSLENFAARIRAALHTWFGRFAQAFGSRRICICLSGGLDSALIAAFARQYFHDVRAYTYVFADAHSVESDDLRSAKRLAEYLGIPLRGVPATADQVLASVDAALIHGQDWRDFNVHCAIVNYLLGRAVAEDARDWRARPLLLTGDLMNEIMADYTPVTYRGREYYVLPRLRIEELRLALVRGLDAGDREMGVFQAHGLDALQSYSFLLEDYLQVSPHLLGSPDSKQDLVRAVAGDMLPTFILARKKVRAQIGDQDPRSGILPLLVDKGHDSAWLRRRFCELFQVADKGFLDEFVVMGRYRSPGKFPGKELEPSGFYGRSE